MNTVQQYTGANALSAFRRKKLLAKLQAIEPSITDVSANFVHIVDAKQKLTPEQLKQLELLLMYDTPSTATSNGALFLVVPRVGTISPWSSKATDIAHNAGLDQVARIERGIAYYVAATKPLDREKISSILHDRMTDDVLAHNDETAALFSHAEPKPYVVVDILAGGANELRKANSAFGLALADDEIDYLVDAYQNLGRNPTDAELMMFGAVNSEHCRHKIFNADWVIDGEKQPKSLFKMIKNTYELGGEDVLSAYSDNAAVVAGPTAGRFFPDADSHEYGYHQEPIHLVIKVETHNHPTAIAPFPGAATGTGGEIRDEGATGRGAKPKMGLAGFTVSNLNLPDAPQPWEKPYGKPDRITTPLGIMIDAPLGGAAFANEFGRPNLAGFFRTYEQSVGSEIFGYHKPIMIAGGLGNIRDMHVQKNTIQPGARIIVLGGPAMLIGLGGGAASSMQTGTSAADLDFASVQRGNAEMERRCQEVIDTCWALGEKNPMISIHDIGAGGYSNALPELVHDSGIGAVFQLRDLPNAEPGLSPLEIWCNEAQERYVMGVNESDVARFEAICKRERCPYAIVGIATAEEQLVVRDSLLGNDAVNLPMTTLFGKPPKMIRSFDRIEPTHVPLNLAKTTLQDAVKRVLHLPAVGSKKFLITIGDRSITGLVTRDQMVGPWQVPVSDVAVTAASFDTDRGEVMTMGERMPLAAIDAPASARMGIAETITNILASDVSKLSDIKLSANWMAAAGYGHEDQHLYDAVRAVGEEFCPALGLTIPVGKDSLSMRTVWQEDGEQKSVVSPLSLIITGFSPVHDVTKTLTPQLDTSIDSSLIFIDLSGGKTRLGGSALAQVYNQTGDMTPDADAITLKKFFDVITTLKQQGKILAYHDRSDGGLFTTLAEMAFASRCGLDIELSGLPGSNLERLFNEELGAVIQVKTVEVGDITKVLSDALGDHYYILGKPTKQQAIVFKDAGDSIYENTRAQLENWWSETSYQVQKLRDNPVCADQEYATITDDEDPGLTPLIKKLPDFNKIETSGDKPRIAIFREQGVNGQIEMAAAFDRAGFATVDVHLNDLISGQASLDGFSGLVACGGFSYGDVLGAGGGWAKTILLDPILRKQFSHFFARPDTFTLGVCNGCQMLSGLKELIPGAAIWPKFKRNSSEQFEARVPLVRINSTPSIFFTGLEGSILPIPVAHGEGFAAFDSPNDVKNVFKAELVAGQFVDNRHELTEVYPANPNGSPQGITALTTPDGRATIMMPHPERAFQTRQLSWHPADWPVDSPWFHMFQNAYDWAVEHKRS